MRKVIYSMSVSLDGYIADPGGAIDWAAPGEELMDFHIAQTRELAAHLCGRGLYEDMLPWETSTEARDSRGAEFARLWKAIPKVVCSTTLDHVEGNATLATGSVADEVAKLKDGPGSFASVGGAGLAAAVIALDLIDEYRPFVNPVVLGGGTPFLPARTDRMRLELVETRTFDGGVVYLRYQRV